MLITPLRRHTGITAPQGFVAAGMACGIKKDNALDLALVTTQPPAHAAGVYTRNQVKAAPVVWSTQQTCKGHRVHGVLLNSGNANACTGAAGRHAVTACVKACAQALGVASKSILMASTGIIGVPLPTARLTTAMPELVDRLQSGTRAGRRAAEAIRTTDRVLKQRALQVKGGTHTYWIGGMAKGAGMIHPNMATMLAVLSCDAPLSTAQCRRLLQRAVDTSFNAISVDGDTSTNDCVLLLANGAAGGHVAARGPIERALAEGLQRVCDALAEAIVVDGEGAEKLLTFEVEGTANHGQAQSIARCVVSSPLVKTALAGADPNWGRIIAAAGRAGVPFRLEAAVLRIGPHVVVRRGQEVFGTQTAAARVMRRRRVRMRLTVGGGPGRGRALGCDLTHAYVDINAHYRT